MPTFVVDLYYTVGDCMYSVVGAGTKVACLPKKQKKHKNGGRKRQSRRFLLLLNLKTRTEGNKDDALKINLPKGLKTQAYIDYFMYGLKYF